jgi:uroporphyrinogen decarboxylase
MKPKERVLSAINHQTPDRVPIDFGAQPEVWDALMAALHMDTHEDLLRYLDVDFRYIEPIELIYDRDHYRGPAMNTRSDGSWADIWGVWRRPVRYSHGIYQEIVSYPLTKVTEVEQLLDHPWPQADWFDFSDVPAQCQPWSGEYALVGGSWGATFGDAYRILGMEHFFESLIEAPDVVREVISRVERFYMDVNERIWNAAAGMIDIYYFGNDLGSQLGLLMSPAMIRDFLLPSFRRLSEQARSHGLKVMFHSCGAVSEVIPMLIEIGIDILDPIQTAARGMNPLQLKAQYGDNMTFHGGLDTQGVLPFGSPEDVTRATCELLEGMKPGGGYILAPSQELQPDVPIANILAMYEAAHSTSGRY